MNVDDDEDFRLLYSSCVTELIAFKSQQWSVTNYSVLLYAAIGSVSKLIGIRGQNT